jgi:pimeloyl-ACP methyl ester carboxylesterase
VTYELYEPGTSEPGAPLIVIAHGFMRDLTAMRGWAEHWSARGHRTVAVSFCNSSWLNGRHDRNAEDLAAVADLLTSPGTPVLYAGFSAGGLAALLAASADPDAVGYLGLDPVDSGGLASGILTLDVPGLYLYGEPSSCNADSNMVAAMPDTTGPAARLALRVPFATHCDFESPYDEACSRICGSVEPEAVETEIRATIKSLATAWAEAVIGEDASAASVFAPDQLGELERGRRIEIVTGE